MTTQSTATRTSLSERAPIKVFDQPGEFAACRAAEEWLACRGFSVGRMQGRDPRGILFGDYDIQKWRSLNSGQRIALDATMTGSMRNGPITVQILPFARNEAIAAFTREPTP